MKSKITFYIILLISISVYSQHDIEKFTFEDTQNSEVFESIKNGTTLSSYVSADGSILNVGDTLVIGLPSGSSSVTTGIGAGRTVGVGRAVSKTSDSFTTIMYGKPAGIGNIMSAMNGDGPNYAGQAMQNEIVIISEMSLNHKGSKKKPLSLAILLGEPNGRAFGINKYLSVNDYEKSVLAGEIRSLNAPLTRDQAIAKLKESKELFDLGLLSEEEYEIIKKDMTPIIME